MGPVVVQEAERGVLAEVIGVGLGATAVAASAGLKPARVREALDDARARNLTIVGVCPLVAAFLKKHPEYADATAPVTPAVLEWLRS